MYVCVCVCVMYVLCAVCCVLCAVCCVLCAVCCVLCAVCGVLCAVCGVRCAVCCVLCAAHFSTTLAYLLYPYSLAPLQRYTHDNDTDHDEMLRCEATLLASAGFDQACISELLRVRDA